MGKDTRRRALGNTLGRPADEWLDEDDTRQSLDDLIESNPGAQLILDALSEHPGIDLKFQLWVLEDFGFDVRDPDIIQKAIDYCLKLESDFKSTRRPILPPPQREDSAGAVVYYMRIGNRVKIGWSANLKLRLDTIQPEELLTIERGGRTLEQARHAQFAALRTMGEWFRLEEPLVGYIREIADRFREDFGTSLVQYLDGHASVGAGMFANPPRSYI